MTPAAPTRWLLGVLWGVIVAALQINTLPLASLAPGGLGLAVAWMVLMWCVSGVVLVHAALWLEPRLPAVSYYLSLFGVAVALSALDIAIGGGAYLRTFLGVADPFGVFVHTLWEHLLFGGIGAAALRTSQRDARTREILSHAGVAARESEARLKATAAREMRGQIQPERLVRVVEELKRRYDLDLDRGDRLLERITDFLRAAMPSIRTGVSTLAQELETLEAYGRLLRELEGGAAWRFAPRRQTPYLPFPPLILLPAAEALSNMGGGLLVRLRPGPGHIELELAAFAAPPGAAVPADLDSRLRTSLRSLFNDRATVRLDGASFCIRLPDQRRAPPSRTDPPLAQWSLP